MNKKLLSLFIILAVLATYKCAHLKLQVNLAQSQEEDFETQDYNFFQQKEEEEEYDPEDFDFLSQQFQKSLEENNEREDFSLLQQDIEEENFEMEDFNLLQQQQQEDNKNQDFDINFLQYNIDQWQVIDVKIVVDKFNMHNIFTQEELERFEGSNTKILNENMKVFTERYRINMIPLARFKKRDGQDIKFVTVPFQKQDIGHHWYIEQDYKFDKIIGYVFDHNNYKYLRRNKNFICLISLLNEGVLPSDGLMKLIQKFKKYDYLYSIICLPK